MAELYRTPTDQYTGIPLALMPTPEWPAPLERGARNLECAGDMHHAFHPKHELTGIGHGIGDAALRHSRVQWSAYRTHHDQYHGTFSGPELPKTPYEKYRTIVFATAGYIPSEAITFDPDGSPRFTALSTESRSDLLRSGYMRIEYPERIKEFLLKYAVRHGMPNVETNLVDEFLFTFDNDKKKTLGKKLIELASEATTEPFRDDYTEAKRLRLLPRARSERVGSFVSNFVALGQRGINDKVIRNLRAMILSTSDHTSLTEA